MSGVLNVSQSNTTITVEGVQTKIQSAESKALELKAGDSIQGTVVSVSEEDGARYANISLGDSVIHAKLSDEMGLRQGQTLNFAVKSLSQNAYMARESEMSEIQWSRQSLTDREFLWTESHLRFSAPGKMI